MGISPSSMNGGRGNIASGTTREELAKSGMHLFETSSKTSEKSTSSSSNADAKESARRGMAGSILHAKGGGDTASGALESTSKKSKTLG